MDLASCLARVEAALQDADATLTTSVGGQRELTEVRLWRGQVLVDWEPEARAGGCLLRVDLLRRLAALQARAHFSEQRVVFEASGRVIAALSPAHADLVQSLGGPRRVACQVTLRFADESYRGGDESYTVMERGERVALIRLEADVRLRTARPASPRTSPAPT